MRSHAFENRVVSLANDQQIRKNCRGRQRNATDKRSRTRNAGDKAKSENLHTTNSQARKAQHCETPLAPVLCEKCFERKMRLVIAAGKVKKRATNDVSEMRRELAACCMVRETCEV